MYDIASLSKKITGKHTFYCSNQQFLNKNKLNSLFAVTFRICGTRQWVIKFFGHYARAHTNGVVKLRAVLMFPVEFKLGTQKYRRSLLI